MTFFINEVSKFAEDNEKNSSSIINSRADFNASK